MTIERMEEVTKQMKNFITTMILLNAFNLTEGRITDFFPYQRTSTTLHGDDEFKTGRFPSSLPLGNSRYSNYFISTNGMITFESNDTSYTASDLTNGARQTMIAVYWVDIFVPSSDKVYYEVFENDVGVKRKVTEDIRSVNNDTFIPSWVFVVTWKNARFYQTRESQSGARLTFQCTIATDGKETYAFLNYNGLNLPSTQIIADKVFFGYVIPQFAYTNPYSLDTSGNRAVFRLGTIPGNTGVYPFGVRNGDISVCGRSQTNKTVLSSLLPLGTGYVNSFSVCQNGFVSFNSTCSTFNSNLAVHGHSSFISIFSTDLTPGNQNDCLFYKVYGISDLLKNTSKDISSFNGEAFNGNLAIVITWSKLFQTAARNKLIKALISFQCVLVTDGNDTYALFKYFGLHVPPQLAEAGNVSIGYNLPGLSYENPLQNDKSTYRKVFRLDLLIGNTGKPGEWIYKLTKDPCQDSGCENNSTCRRQESLYTCICPPGFTGVYCETDIDECASNPCMNGGSCADVVNGYSCNCSQGYNGSYCQIDIDECDSGPCINNGSCVDLVNNYRCECASGYTDKNCQTDIDECESGPCMNGGSCSNIVNSYRCDCASGYACKTCDKDINECRSLPCLNGGSCIDQINSYSCNCVLGYTGLNCETDINECASSPCLNGGTCFNLINEFNCRCPLGYSGPLCQTDVNECASSPCLNGATCLNLINEFSCRCPLGYSGPLCQRGRIT